MKDPKVYRHVKDSAISNDHYELIIVRDWTEIGLIYHRSRVAEHVYILHTFIQLLGLTFLM